MIREFRERDFSMVMDIWLASNVEAHSFVEKEYWMNNYEMVKSILPQAEVFVYENESADQIEGFIGLTENYIAGLFVKADRRSHGLGKQLLDYVKKLKPELRLSVYQKNARAIQFYNREEFSVVDEGRDPNTNEKELIMVWRK